MAFAELSYTQYLTYFKTLTSMELKKYEATEIWKKLDREIYSLKSQNEDIKRQSVEYRKPLIRCLISALFGGVFYAALGGLIGALIGLIVGIIVRIIYLSLSHKSYFIISYICTLLFGKIDGLDISLLQFSLYGFAIVAVPLFVYLFIGYIKDNYSLPTKQQIYQDKQADLTYNNTRIKRLNEQKQYYKKTIDDIENCLDRYYSAGLINRDTFGGLVAVGTIYTFFSNRICSTLYGDKGALARYDYEVKYRIIIAKLDEIINALHTIQGNQRILADMIENSNRNISKICNTVNEQLDSVNYKLDTVNYYQNVSNVDLKYLTWLNSGYWKF